MLEHSVLSIANAPLTSTVMEVPLLCIPANHAPLAKSPLLDRPGLPLAIAPPTITVPEVTPANHAPPDLSAVLDQ